MLNTVSTIHNIITNDFNIGHKFFKNYSSSEYIEKSYGEFLSNLELIFDDEHIVKITESFLEDVHEYFKNTKNLQNNYLVDMDLFVSDIREAFIKYFSREFNEVVVNFSKCKSLNYIDAVTQDGIYCFLYSKDYRKDCYYVNLKNRLNYQKLKKDDQLKFNATLYELFKKYKI